MDLKTELLKCLEELKEMASEYDMSEGELFKAIVLNYLKMATKKIRVETELMQAVALNNQVKKEEEVN